MTTSWKGTTRIDDSAPCPTTSVTTSSAPTLRRLEKWRACSRGHGTNPLLDKRLELVEDSTERSTRGVTERCARGFLVLRHTECTKRNIRGTALRDTPSSNIRWNLLPTPGICPAGGGSRPSRARPPFFQTPGAVVHPQEPQHSYLSTRTPPRTQERQFKHLKTWLVTQNCASPPSRPSAAGAAACGSPNVRRAGEAGQASEPRRPARTMSGHRDSLQLCSEFCGVMRPVIQKRQQASGSLPKASKVHENVPGLAKAGAPPGETATVADTSKKDTSICDIRVV